MVKVKVLTESIDVNYKKGNIHYFMLCFPPAARPSPESQPPPQPTVAQSTGPATTQDGKKASKCYSR